MRAPVLDRPGSGNTRAHTARAVCLQHPLEHSRALLLIAQPRAGCASEGNVCITDLDCCQEAPFCVYSAVPPSASTGTVCECLAAARWRPTRCASAHAPDAVPMPLSFAGSTTCLNQPCTTGPDCSGCVDASNVTTVCYISLDPSLDSSFCGCEWCFALLLGERVTTPSLCRVACHQPRLSSHVDLCLCLPDIVQHLTALPARPRSSSGKPLSRWPSGPCAQASMCDATRVAPT